MAKKPARSAAGDKQQRSFEEAKKKADQSGSYGKQAHEIAERAHMKRQKKQMHQQDNK